MLVELELLITIPMLAWGGAAGGLFGMAGSLGSAAMAAKEAKRNRKFQERMAKTKYQYTMEDMKKAGLNPILAYKGIGGGTPSGSMAAVPDLGGTAAKAAEAGTKAVLSMSQKKANLAQAGAADATARNQDAQANLHAADLPAAMVRGQWAGTPEGTAAIKAKETFGGKGFWPGMAGAAASAWSQAKEAAGEATPPRGPRVLSEAQKRETFGPIRKKPNFGGKSKLRQRPLWPKKRNR